MHPAKFDYSAPTSLDEALTLLTQHGDGAKILAGGHSLLPLLKLRFAEPSHLVDLRRIPGLAGVRWELGSLVIGAMTTHSTIAESLEIQAALPILTDAASQIGDPQVRHRGTIGGSLAHADPSADFPAVMLATNARMIAAGPRGRREIAASDFFIDLLTSALEPNEVLTEIRIPLPSAGTGGAYSKHPHPASRFAVVGIAAVVTLADNAVSDARIAVTGLGTKAKLATNAAAALIGKAPDAATIGAAAALVSAGIEPREDSQGNAAYKEQLARVHAGRAINAAVERARQAGR